MSFEITRDTDSSSHECCKILASTVSSMKNQVTWTRFTSENFWVNSPGLTAGLEHWIDVPGGADQIIRRRDFGATTACPCEGVLVGGSLEADSCPGPSSIMSGVFSDATYLGCRNNLI